MQEVNTDHFVLPGFPTNQGNETIVKSIFILLFFFWFDGRFWFRNFFASEALICLPKFKTWSISIKYLNYSPVKYVETFSELSTNETGKANEGDTLCRRRNLDSKSSSFTEETTLAFSAKSKKQLTELFSPKSLKRKQIPRLNEKKWHQ